MTSQRSKPALNGGHSPQFSHLSNLFVVINVFFVSLSSLMGGDKPGKLGRFCLLFSRIVQRVKELADNLSITKVCLPSSLQAENKPKKSWLLCSVKQRALVSKESFCVQGSYVGVKSFSRC